MERREFFIKSGMVLTAAGFLQSFAGLAGSPYKAMAAGNIDDRTGRRPDPDSFTQPVMKAIALGINAPSPHNTQSWKFKILDDVSMLFYIDRDILLPETDPPSRQLHIGAGCFIETLAIGITRYGYAATIRYFPQGYHSPEDFGQKPVAEIRITETTGKVHPLAAYVADRQTNRQPSTGGTVEKSTFESLMGLAGKSHSRVLFFNESLDAFKELFYTGLEIESRTRRTNEETRLLFRFSEAERAANGDGLSMPQMGYKGMLLNIVEKSVKNGDPDIWHAPGTLEKSLKHIKKSIDSTRAVVLWVTESNTYNDWVENGRDYVRFSLAATASDLYLHPYNQPIQEYPEMDSVRAAFDKHIGITGNQKIQFVARIGESKPTYYTYRKPLSRYML
jgi:hypothetical protein